MTEVYSTMLDRRDFGDLLTAAGVSRRVVQVSARHSDVLAERPLGQTILVIWSQDPRETVRLPELLVCEDGTEQDWTAWITTIAARIRPFSAYMRLLPYSQFKSLSAAVRLPVLGKLTWPAAGMILGEVLAGSGLPDTILDGLPAAACTGTLSFALFRAAAVYADFSQWDELLDGWNFTRDVTRQRHRKEDADGVVRICAIVIEAAGGSVDARWRSRSNRVLVDACRQLMKASNAMPPALFEIPQLRTAAKQMEGTREGRVIAFKEFTNSLGDQKVDSELTSFALGFLASRIAPGTLQHASLLTPLVRRYASSHLWYGFFAGLSGESLSEGEAQRSIVDLPASARRAVRDLLRPESIFNAPTCDIGVQELAALAKTSKEPLGGVIASSSGQVSVELLPLVATSISVAGRDRADRMRPNNTEERESLLRERELLQRMGESLEYAREAYRRLIAGGSSDEAPAQQSLFTKRKR